MFPVQLPECMENGTTPLCPLIHVPPTPLHPHSHLKYVVCKKKNHPKPTMEELFIFEGPLHSLLQLSQTHHPKLDPALEAYLSCTQHAGDFSHPAYNILVCTVKHNVCSLCNAAAWLTHDHFVYQTLLCCLSNPHPLSTYTPDYSYQNLIFCACPV